MDVDRNIKKVEKKFGSAVSTAASAAGSDVSTTPIPKNLIEKFAEERVKRVASRICAAARILH